ncbi:DMT family transporter [Desulfovibrio sp. JC010]|uniref:DMT family transporter n=1 Tax=Desulfovibrio sp. JC010 TaxID=2593641 RepID=UPI0013CF6D48|nr:DMT family transporter [Desulfovibrio sp. JC010]NDV27072.1 DMT family transporter [Desulfovibrio sp. JC010]
MVKGLIYSILSALGLGTLAIFFKIGLGMGLEPLELVQYRFTVGAIALFVWLGVTSPKLLKVRPRVLLKAAVLGIGIYPLQSWLFIMALKHIPASTTSLIYYFYPLMTTLIAVVFLKLRPGRSVFAALGLIIVGSGLVFYNAFAQQLDTQGIMYALGCMLCFSVYLTVIQIFTRNDEAKTIVPYVILCMALVFSSLSSPLKIFDLNMQGWFIAVGLGLIPTALAISQLYRAVDAIGSANVAIFSTIEPVTTVLLAAFVLGEHIAPVQIAGMGFILLGIILPNLQLLKRKAAIGN